MKVKRRSAGVLLAIGFLALAGCASDDDPNTEATASAVSDPNAGKGADSPGIAINPCDLLEADEVGEALGEEVGEGVRDEQVCKWTSTEDEDLSLSVTAFDRGRTPRETCDAYFGRADRMIEGLGIRASYSEEEGFVAFTRSGDFAVEGIPACLVFDPSQEGTPSVEELQGLVETILSREPFKT